MLFVSSCFILWFCCCVGELCLFLSLAVLSWVVVRVCVVCCWLCLVVFDVGSRLCACCVVVACVLLLVV